MSDETPEEISPEKPAAEEKPAAKKATKKKTARKRAAKKATAEVKEPNEAPAETGETASEEQPKEEVRVRRISKKIIKEDSAEKPGKSDEEGDPPASEPAESSASEEQGGGGKRRRRRRRKGGEEGEDGERKPRVQLDPQLVAKKAWKIYLAEVSEEGLALISDQDARELGRRSFKLAEIFLEEAARRS